MYMNQNLIGATVEEFVGICVRNAHWFVWKIEIRTNLRTKKKNENQP